jgi:hypothetical protein
LIFCLFNVQKNSRRTLPKESCCIHFILRGFFTDFSNSNVNDISHKQISIHLKDIGVQTDKHFKTGVPVRSKAVQTKKWDAKHGLLANVACSPFVSPWKVTVTPY